MFVVLRPVLVRESSLLVWGSKEKKNLRVLLVFCVGYFSGLFRLSPISVSCVFCLFFFVCEFSGKGGRWCPLSYLFPSLWPSLAYQRMAPNASVSFRRNRGTNFAPLCTVSPPVLFLFSFSQFCSFFSSRPPCDLSFSGFYSQRTIRFFQLLIADVMAAAGIR